MGFGTAVGVGEALGSAVGNGYPEGDGVGLGGVGIDIMDATGRGGNSTSKMLIGFIRG